MLRKNSRFVNMRNLENNCTIALQYDHLYKFSLFQVKASDRDSGYDGELMYVISGGDDDSVFEVWPH